MTRGTLDRRALIVLVIGVSAILLIRFGVYRQSAAPVVTGGDSIQTAEARLAQMRRLASMVPAKETELKRVRAELAAREKGMLVADTAAQAQAQLVEIIRGAAGKEEIDARGAELRIKPLTGDYAEVLVTVNFTCRIEQLVNLMAALANEPRIVATDEVQVAVADARQKSLRVKMTVAGLVPGRLIPKKPALGAF